MAKKTQTVIFKDKKGKEIFSVDLDYDEYLEYFIAAEQCNMTVDEWILESIKDQIKAENK